MKISTMFTAAVTATFMSGAAFAADIYKTDQGHTEVRVGWSHAGVSMQHGEFTKTDGTLVLDPENIGASTVSAVIDAASISTGFVPLDDHIKSADFLEVETYPEITFQSTGVVSTGDKTADITGDLTLHGVTKPIVLQATLTHLGDHPLGPFIDYYKGDWSAFTAQGEIESSEFGVGATIPVGKLTIAITTEMKSPE